MKTLARFLCPVVALLVFPMPTAADGVFVWKNEKIDILEPEQKALIYFDQGREDLVTSVRFEGAPDEFGWIVPLPAVPEMYPEDAVLFELLSKATQEPRYERSQWGVKLHGTLASVEDAVRVVKSESVGMYDATVIEGGKGSALHDWLAAHGFRPPQDADRVLQRYIDDGWVFACLKIKPAEMDSATAGGLRSGTIQPVRFRFACDEPVFPLEISSLGSGPSGVLLYVLSRDALVPCTPEPGAWRSHVRTAGGREYWMQQYETAVAATASAGFLPRDAKPLYLTKHRARFSPDAMKDVNFDPYNPSAALYAQDLRARREAVAYIAEHKAPDAADLLLEFLAAAEPGPEVYGILWALGEVGGQRAETALLERLDDPDPEGRLEAVEALARMESRAMLPRCVREIEGYRLSGTKALRFAEAAVQRACFDHLVADGDPATVPAIRRIAALHDGAGQWARWAQNRKRFYGVPGYERIDPGLLAVAALAACGDDAARRQIVEALVAGGEVTRIEHLQAEAMTKGSVNGHPTGFWLGLAVQHPVLTQHPWAAFAWASDLFAVNPAFRDGLYRQAARDARLTDAGVVVLLGNLDVPNDADIHRLLDIWKRSIRDPATIDVWDVDAMFVRRSGTSATRESPLTIRYNYTACCVARVLGKYKRGDDLLRLLDDVPEDDPVLRGDVVYAMAMIDGDECREAVVSYIRDAWDRNARTAEFQDYVLGRFERTTPGVPQFLSLELAPFDIRYRTRPIEAFVLRRLDTARARELMTDRDLAPYLRLYLLRKLAYRIDRSGELIEVAQHEVETMIDNDGGVDPVFDAYADWVRGALARFSGRVSDKVEAEVLRKPR